VIAGRADRRYAPGRKSTYWPLIVWREFAAAAVQERELPLAQWA
jgi:hypothetical protein